MYHFFVPVGQITSDHEPEILLQVEVREHVYIYSEIIPGPGGMPVGTNGKAMVLLSGGIDSPVAGYMGVTERIWNG